ncbi:acyl-CoA dehydrogenase C-terminal domain-containing protein [Phaeovibrio sulfidiphilus]|uniref:3-methylmercaptopropionyl-CoA dehydrogenase n=1 Tax=Phaeovibrio sulfidiphilus TaxID=1220600 RepID=A0A8J6YPU9_9PROT|nr:acyl-CoA dehydrogenase C-terminal domain-containing protein [Phaeovibrio sulfidiphilus]MBE1237466.1 acyl-CoA dehydrogenase C-terminal domain-containing protein [Phaeovibrio sulfidiphilus]
MAAYKAPLRDMRYLLHDVFQGANLASLPGFEEFTPDLLDAVLDEAAKITENVLHPLNRSGDEEGCRIENGQVRTPKGFPEAYQAFREGGWTSVSSDPAWGGQGLPRALNTLIEEMICSANVSFSLYPGLTHGACITLGRYASPELQETYLPKMVEGVWSGTMCLTEPHAGTDLGLLRTTARPLPDGSYSVTGTKIFITAGDHDLTENIIHLVLARLPDAPKGVGGISLFLVPKYVPDASGKPGEPNNVVASALEHKMGIKASATCVMNFDDSRGWMVGEPNKGLRALFTMMNTERLGVGLQGLALAEASYQGAATYALERLQGRSVAGPRFPDLPADPIIVHPDVRRMLLTQRAYAEGCRALAVWVAMALDNESRNPDPEERAAASDLVALMTPVVKALLTDLGSEAANLGMQVLGGHGYIREHGMEQYVRDCRIAQIYEGTNGIQALDLVGRKLPEGQGRLLRQFFHPVEAFIAEHSGNEALAPFIGPLQKVFGRLQQATGFIAERGMADPEEAGAASSDYLRLFGFTALAWLWARMVVVSMPKVGTHEDPTGFHVAKIATARFFMERVLPQTSGLFAAIMAGGGSMSTFPDEAFGDRN